MTHKSLRNTVGITSLTALALTMVACGGSSTSDPVAVNHAPVVSAVSPLGAFTTLVSNHSYAYTVSASDADGDAFAFSANPATGITFSGNTMMVTRTAAAAASTVAVTATETKTGGVASAAFTVNLPAVVADTLPGNLIGETVVQGATATLSLPTTDVDGDTYTYTLASGGTYTGTAVLTGNILNMPTTLATVAGAYTQKLSVQQKNGGANVGAPVVIDVTINVSQAVNTAPNFVGNNGVLAPAGRACTPSLIGILTATDSELDQFKYFIVSSAKFAGNGTGTGSFFADLNNNGVQDTGEALEISATAPTFGALTVPAVASNTQLKLYWIAPSDVDGGTTQTIKVGAVDARGAVDLNGFTFQSLGSKNSVAQIGTAGFTGWGTTAAAGNTVSGATGAQTAAATASGTVLEGTATTITWTNIADIADAGVTDYPLTVTLAGAPAGVTLGNGTATGVTSLTLASGTNTLTMSWTPNHLQGRQVHNFTIEVTDAKCTTKKATIALALTVNGIIYASEGTGFVFDGNNSTSPNVNDSSLGSRNVGNDFNQAAAQFVARPYTGGAYVAGLNETDANSTATGGARVDNVAPATFWLVNTTFNPTVFYRTTATPVAAAPSFAPAFWGTGLDFYLGRYLQGRNQTAVETATAVAAIDTSVRFGMTNLTAFDVANDNLVLHIPNLQQSHWYGANTNPFTTLNSATMGVNFPVGNAITGSNVTLTLPSAITPVVGVSHLWAAGGSTNSAADADWAFLAHNRMSKINTLPAKPEFFYSSAIQAVALQAKTLTDGMTNDINDITGASVFNMTSSPAAMSVPMLIDRNSYNQYVSSVHGQVTNIAYSQDTFNVGAVLSNANGPTNGVVTLFNLSNHLGHVNNLNGGTAAANTTFAVTNPLAGFGYSTVTNYTYTFAVTNMFVSAADSIPSQIATMGSNTPGEGYATAKTPGILPILNPRVDVTAGLQNVNVFPPYSVVAGSESIDLGAGSSAAGFKIRWTYDNMNGGLAQATTQSGLIVELYTVTLAGAVSTVAAAPAYTFVVGSGVNGIEVPPAGVAAGTYVVRIKNVSTKNGSTLINFDVTPNVKGFPYHWSETVGAIRVQ